MANVDPSLAGCCRYDNNTYQYVMPSAPSHDYPCHFANTSVSAVEAAQLGFFSVFTFLRLPSSLLFSSGSNSRVCFASAVARFSVFSMGLDYLLGVHPSFDASHKFVTSPFLRSPLTFGLVRLVVALYTILVLLVSLIWKSVKLDEGNRCVFPSYIYSSLAKQTLIIATSPTSPTSFT